MSPSYRGSRYQILGVLGEGGTGSVFRARDSLDGGLVALKVFSSEAGPGGEGHAPLLARSEFRILASQSHPGIVRVFDYGLTLDGLPYFTMELLEGRDLLELTAELEGDRAGLAENATFRGVLCQVLEALDHIHRRGLLHLDLKPSNILVTAGERGEPVAKLIDFGFARGRDSVAGDALSGTLEYLAPEVIRGEPPGPRSDLYSLGIILHETLTGTCPFRGATPGEVVRGHLERPVPEPEKVPAKLRGAVLRLLEKQPSRRFSSARAVLEDLFPEEASKIQPLPAFGAALVGREDLVRRLQTAIRAPGCHSFLLRGSTGIGKTRILRELEVRLQLEGATVALVACREAGDHPGDLLARLLRRAAIGCEDAAADLITRAAVPGVACGSGAEPSPGGFDAAEAEARREQLISRATDRLLELAANGPAVLMVDDFQRSDSLSRDALVHLMRAMEHRGGTGLCLFLAARDEDGADREALEEVEKGVRGFATFESVLLGGLGEAEVERYLVQVLGLGAVPEELSRSLARETGGNVFFIEEYLKLLVRTGRLRARAAGWEMSPGERAEVPRTVEEAISRRLARANGPAREALEWAAVLDAPFSAEELSALASGEAAKEDALTSRESERLLSELVLEQVLAREGTRYFFSHAAARSVVHRAMADDDRRRRHGIAAEMLLAEPQRGAGERLEEIAHHLFHSREPRRAQEYLLRAGERARRTGALREAALHLSRALEVTGEPAARADILLRRQEVLGHLGRKDAQREDLEALKSLARELGSSGLEREAALREALFLESLGRKREALDRVEEVLSRGAGDPGGEARLLARAGMLHLYLSDFDAGFAALRRALDHARAVRDRVLEAECRQIAGLGHYLRGGYDEAIAEMSASLAIRREEGEEHRSGSLESNLGVIHFDRGDLEAAEERFLASLKVFRRLGLRRGEAVNLLNLGLVCLEMGRFEPALDNFHESLRLRRELGDRRAEGADLGNLAAAWILVGRLERAVPLLEEALHIARELENHQSESANECRMGQIELERGNAAAAGERFERGREIAVRFGIPAQEVIARMGFARSRLAGGEKARARAEAEAALGLAESRRMRRRALGCRVLLAEILLAEGKAPEADEAARAAVEEIEELGGGADAHAAWFWRHRTLAALGKEAESEAALRRAYILLGERGDAFQDDELRRGYMENVPLHREITRLHEELQTRNRREASRRERSFHEIAKSIHSITEIDPLLERLLGLAIETTHAEKGLVALKNAGGDFTIRAARGMAKESVEDATDICKSVIEDVARGGGPVLATDAGSDDRFRDRRSIISFRIQTLMCVPMVLRDEIIGAVYVDGRGVSSFHREDLEYLVSFAQLAAIAVENARLLERLRTENLYLRREVETRFRFENLIGESPPMRRLVNLMEKVADTPASILISGETGTGKEIVARAIHYASGRRSRPFVTVDCGALPENLLESELFGHRRGAFSGAIHDRLGLFEEAEGGTIFLDEITNTSPDLQAKLLRVLQEGEIRRVGENPVRKVDVRVIAATNVDMRAAVEKGAFREDLYYRLNVIPIEVPPLRERREDIPILALHFLKESCDRHAKAIAGFTEESMDLLARAPWRGNVRELENLIEKAVILAEKDRLDAGFLEGLLAPSARPPASGAGPGAGEGGIVASAAASARDAGALQPLADTLGSLSLEDFDRRWIEAERGYLQRLVDDAEGNLSEAARRARVRNRNTLISRLKRHGIRGRGKE